MRYRFYLSVLALLVLSCSEEGEMKKIFNGEVVIIDNKPDIDTLYGERVKLDGIYAGFMAAYDSIIVFSSHQYETALGCLSLVFNLKTGDQISSLIKVGEGPGEYTMGTTTHQFHIDNDAMKIWYYDYFIKKICILVNINDNTVSDSIDFSWLKPDRKEPSSRFFILNDSLFLAFNMEEPASNQDNENVALPQVWSLYNYKTKEKIRQYDVFNDFIYFDSYFGLASEDQLKPDNTKLVIPMMYLPQINIVDIQTGEIKGYVFKGNLPDYASIKHHYEEQRYFFRTCVDNDFIYAAKYEENNVFIDVFDWNGNYLKQLVLDKHMVEFITLDPVHKYLYIPVIGEDEEEIYRYDVSYLYE
jgi:hypothetical protein